MNKIIPLLICGVAALWCAGCASSGVVSMGKDTYMVSRKGGISSTGFSLKAKCLIEADKYCSKKGLAMVVLQSTERDPGFAQWATCELIFKAVPTNSVENVPPNVKEEHYVH